MRRLRIVVMLGVAASLSVGLLACGGGTEDSVAPEPAAANPAPVPPASAPAPLPAASAPAPAAAQPAPPPAPVNPAYPNVLFERGFTVNPRTTESYEFEVKKPGTLRIEVKPEARTFVTIENPVGSFLLNEFKVKTGEELDREVTADRPGKYTIRVNNSNLVKAKRVSVKITAKP